MNSAVKKLLLYTPAAVLGLFCAGLQNRILTAGFDRKGLLIAGNPDLMLLWGITGLYLLAVLVLALRLNERDGYAANFPACVLSGCVMTAAGLLVCFSGVNRLVPGMILTAALTMAVGVLMGIAGLFRLLGRNPSLWPDLLIGLYYAGWLLTSYTGWNADPNVQRYAFHLLAGVAVLLFTLHRARMAALCPERRKLVFFGFAGIFLCFTALPGAGDPLFLLSAGLWCAGGMCDLKK